MLKRADCPEYKHTDSMGYSRAIAVHTHRVGNRDGGEIVIIENKLCKNINTNNYIVFLNLNNC